jgi:hypothetical protein
VFSIASLVLRGLEFGALNCRWDDNAYGSIVWTLLGLHTLHIVADTGESAVLAVLAFVEKMDGPRFVDVSEEAVYGYFVVLTWLPIYAVVYWAPRSLLKETPDAAVARPVLSPALALAEQSLAYALSGRLCDATARDLDACRTGRLRAADAAVSPRWRGRRPARRVQQLGGVADVGAVRPGLPCRPALCRWPAAEPPPAAPQRRGYVWVPEDRLWRRPTNRRIGALRRRAMRQAAMGLVALGMGLERAIGNPPIGTSCPSSSRRFVRRRSELD